MSVSDGRIVEVCAAQGSNRPSAGDIDARDCLLLPGFVDIHVHGGAGRGTMEARRDAQDDIARHLAAHGVTGFLPTTITGPWELQAEAVAVAASAMGDGANRRVGASVLGVHLEGPYINPKKKGAQPEQFIRPPDPGDLERHLGDNVAALKIVTLAPEVDGATALIRYLVDRGTIVSIGHTDATYAQVVDAIALGARHVTHCFNAMRPMESREPGVVGAAMARPELRAELIWDNIHVHPASCRALVKAKGAAGMVLISDGIPGSGMQDGFQFSLGDLPVTIHDGSARLPDGTLAGSLLTLDLAFANAAEFGLSDRSAMISYNPALALGLGHRKGLLAPGYDADLVLLGADGAVRATVVGGELIYDADAR
ncbi:MAG TPA: N-acetylglucosamine-6-phosphate deacetylase [Chthonomonadaceae bacterium]|nr:N-acetylglucosamine-6-phosphate deacetylase [Chthonomonadaceae bacterium]